VGNSVAETPALVKLLSALPRFNPGDFLPRPVSSALRPIVKDACCPSPNIAAVILTPALEVEDWGDWPGTSPCNIKLPILPNAVPRKACPEFAERFTLLIILPTTLTIRLFVEPVEVPPVTADVMSARVVFNTASWSEAWTRPKFDVTESREDDIWLNDEEEPSE